MSYGNEITHQDILRKQNVLDFLEWYDDRREVWLDPNEYQTTRDVAGDDLDEYDGERIAELRIMAEAEDSSFISENYWKDYAREYADELLESAGAFAREYFDYKSFAADLQSDYQNYEYDGVTYWGIA